MTAPLEGIRVVDLTSVLSGPLCTMMLGDAGAEVIKVEKMPNGDDTCRTVPPKIGDEAAAFMMMNRNKRGMSSSQFAMSALSALAGR